jgi:hypothetical protein
MQSVVASSLAVIALVSATGVASSAVQGPWIGRRDSVRRGRYLRDADRARVRETLERPEPQQGFSVIAGPIAFGLVITVVLKPV